MSESCAVSYCHRKIKCAECCTCGSHCRPTTHQPERKASSTGNVTAEEIKHWLETGDGPDEGYPGWTKRLRETARRGLEMRGETERALQRLDANILSTEDGIRHIRGAFKAAIKKFDGGGDADTT